MHASPPPGLIVPHLETSAIFKIARDIIAFEKGAHLSDPEAASGPPLQDWSKTLVVFPGIIARSEAGPFLEPLFWVSQDLRWAVTTRGLSRLGEHIDDVVRYHHRQPDRVKG